MSQRAYSATLLAILSGLSCYSLLGTGIASAALSLAFSSWSGCVVGVAAAAHGGFEWRERSRALSLQGEKSASLKRMAGNQVALAVTVALYLAWQSKLLNDGELLAMFERDPVRSLMEQLPADLASQVMANASRGAAILLALTGVTVLAGCLGMAGYYLRTAKASDARSFLRELV